MTTDAARKPLVTVERQYETDIATGTTQVRMFVKMYFEARDSGLLSDMPDDLWKTLCLLATYVDRHGFCYPSQDTIARALGIGRQAANQRLQRLRRYRFKGQPVISVTRERVRSAKGPTRWGRNVYQLHPIAAFAFGNAQVSEGTASFSMSSQRDIESSMSSSMSRLADIDGRDTNKNHLENEITHGVRNGKQSNARALVARFHELLGHPERRPSAKELRQAAALIANHGPAEAAHIVAFGVAAAAQTRFEMRHFGAILSYTQDALREKRRTTRSKLLAEEAGRKVDAEAELRSYERWRNDEVARILGALSDGERNALERETREHVLTRYGDRAFGLETLIKIELSHLVAERHAIPDFEAWCSHVSTTAGAKTRAA